MAHTGMHEKATCRTSQVARPTSKTARLATCDMRHETAFSEQESEIEGKEAVALGSAASYDSIRTDVLKTRPLIEYMDI